MQPFSFTLYTVNNKKKLNYTQSIKTTEKKGQQNLSIFACVLYNMNYRGKELGLPSLSF